MIRTLLFTLLAGSLVACDTAQDQAAPTPEPIEPSEISVPAPAAPADEDDDSIALPSAAPAETPASLTRATETYTASAELPDGLSDLAPQLDSRLRADIQAAFDQLAVISIGDAMASPDAFRPYNMTINWTLTAEAGDLLSLEGFNYSNTGGAHGNYFIAGLIHDRASASDILVLDLFTDREAALARLVPLVRSEITAAKMVNYGETGTPSRARLEETEEALPMSGSWLSETVLVPSTEPGRFGGLVVHFSPYDIGSFAEGAYRAEVPQAAFRDLLKPAYQALFAGDPVAYSRD